ncbi:response regulator [Pirellulimonas nuda]|uniref:response regulator n=1 Tax=Pirellulimonas nuda TaxID=2528009 RepID=UPI0011A57B49|nr:response regulator [Pirellulimonas nuda]
MPETPFPDAAPRVLVFDRSSESREVLRTLLARRGVRTLDAANGGGAVRLAESEDWALLVADAESDLSSNAETIVQLRNAAHRKGAPFLLLGSTGKIGDLGALAGDTCLQKPYHYGALLHRIGELLRDRPAA